MPKTSCESKHQRDTHEPQDPADVLLVGPSKGHKWNAKESCSGRVDGIDMTSRGYELVRWGDLVEPEVAVEHLLCKQHMLVKRCGHALFGASSRGVEVGYRNKLVFLAGPVLAAEGIADCHFLAVNLGNLELELGLL